MGILNHMAVGTQRRLTADEFFALPGEQKFTELIDGELVVDTPSMRHQDIVQWLIIELALFSRRHPDLGRPGLELATTISDDSVYLPDLWWTTPAHTPALDTNRHVAPPDLVIEVRSPTTWAKDLGTKKNGYEAIGVPELWLIDTQGERVLVFRRSSPATPTFDLALEFTEGDTLTTPLVPGLQIDVTAIFDR